MSLVQWECIPDDVVLAILLELVKPLRNNENLEKRVGDRPTHFEETVYAYFNLLVTSKQFNRVTTKLDFDWLTLVGTYGNYSNFRHIREQQKKQEALLDPREKASLVLRGLPYLADEPKKMLRTLTMWDCSLPVMRSEIDSFMAKHHLVYHTKASGKIYKGFVGIRKLKTIKIQPKNLDCQFKAMLKKHESLHKKRLALTKALHAHVYANRDKPEPIGLWVVFKNIQ